MNNPLPRFRARQAHQKLAVAFVCLSALGGASGAAAASIALHQDAVTAVVQQRLFTSNGKRVLSGSLASCTYVYLEQPAVTFRDRRLYLRVHLAGRVGLKSGGSCVGAGDAFFTTVSGVPTIAGDTIALKDFRQDEGRAEYRGLLEPLLKQQIPALLGLNLREELSKGLEKSGSQFRLTVTRFQLMDVKVADGMLAVNFDFALQANKP